jgi:hypothetical protein
MKVSAYSCKHCGNNSSIGNMRWVLLLPPKVEVGRVCEECRKRNERALQELRINLNLKAVFQSNLHQHMQTSFVPSRKIT